MSRTTDLAERTLAAITPGQWETGIEIDGIYSGRRTVVYADEPGSISSRKRVVTVGQTRQHHTKEVEDNIAFIAAAPALVRELIAEVKDLERIRDALLAECDLVEERAGRSTGRWISVSTVRELLKAVSHS